MTGKEDIVSAPLVSVVTPFYDTADYLAECIESVLGQAYGNFEYVLVDNRSTDGSGEIAAQYAARDARVRLIRSERHRPRIPNYNFALEQISGDAKYCKMVQADDWIFPGCLAQMVEVAEAHPSVGVVSAYDLRERIVGEVGLHASTTFVPGRSAARLYLVDGIHLFGSPSTVMFRADLVRARRPFFRDKRLHPDTEGVLDLLAGSDFGFVHQVLSFIREQEDSVTGRARPFGPHSLDRLINVKDHGRLHLDAEEYRRCLASVRSAYYDDLAHHMWRQGRMLGALWAYHREGLATIGEKPDWRHLGPALGKVLLDEVSNPGRLVRKIQRRLQGREPENALPATLQLLEEGRARRGAVPRDGQRETPADRPSRPADSRGDRVPYSEQAPPTWQQ